MSGTQNRGSLIAPPFPRVRADSVVPGSDFNNAMAQIERAFSTLPDVYAYLKNSFADDTAAAAGGVPIGRFYRTASVVKVRVT